MSFHCIKIIGSFVCALLLAGSFALYAQAQTVDPCSYGCPKEGCPKCKTAVRSNEGHATSTRPSKVFMTISAAWR